MIGKNKLEIFYGLFFVCFALWFFVVFLSGRLNDEIIEILIQQIYVFVLFVISFLIIKNFDKIIFTRWFHFSSIFFIIDFLMLTFIPASHDFLDNASDYFIYGFWLYFMAFLLFFVYGVFTHRNNDGDGKKSSQIIVRNIRHILIGCFVIVFGLGFIDSSFVFFSTLYLGIPVFFYCCLVLLYNRKSIIDHKTITWSLLMGIFILIVFMLVGASYMSLGGI